MILALTPFAALALCCVPLAVAVGSRFGYRLGAVAALVTAYGVLLGGFLLGNATGLDPMWVTLVGGLVLAVGTAIPARRGWKGMPARTTRVILAASLVGGLLWFGAITVATLLPHGAPLSWAMAGDSANIVHLLQSVILDSGLNLGRGNTVPLPSVILAFAAIPGRSGLTDPALLPHDITALATAWSLGIATTCAMLGLVVSSLLRSHRALVAGIATALGSALGLSWFVLGLPIDSGYQNVHVALPFLLATWLVLAESRRSPATALALLLGISVLLFATWSPLVLFPLVAAALVVVRELRLLRTLSVSASVVLLVATVAFLGWLMAVTLPALLREKAALGAPGHGFPPTIGILAGALLIALALAFVLRTAAPDLRWAVVVLFVASGIGYAGLLYFAERLDDPFNAYYVAKYSWLASILVAAVALALLVRWAADRARPRHALALVAAACTAAIVAAALGPMPLRHYAAVPVPPIARVIDSTVLGSAPWSSGDRIVELVVAGVDDKHPAVYWDSTEHDEAYIDFWLLLFEGGEMGTSKTNLRNYPFYAYRHFRDYSSFTVPDLDQLCGVLDELGGEPVVHTADEDLAEQLAAECPDLSAGTTVLVE